MFGGLEDEASVQGGVVQVGENSGFHPAAELFGGSRECLSVA